MLSTNCRSIVVYRINNLWRIDFLKRWLILSYKKVYVQIKSQAESNKDFKVVKMNFYYTDVKFKFKGFVVLSVQLSWSMVDGCLIWLLAAHFADKITLNIGNSRYSHSTSKFEHTQKNVNFYFRGTARESRHAILYEKQTVVLRTKCYVFLEKVKKVISWSHGIYISSILFQHWE